MKHITSSTMVFGNMLRNEANRFRKDVALNYSSTEHKFTYHNLYKHSNCPSTASTNTDSENE